MQSDQLPQNILNVALNLSQLTLLQGYTKCVEYSNVTACPNSSCNEKSSSACTATFKTIPAWLGFFVQLLATEEWVIFRGIVKWAPKDFTLTYYVHAVCKSLRPRPFMRDSALTSNLADYPEFRDNLKILLFGQDGFKEISNDLRLCAR